MDFLHPGTNVRNLRNFKRCQEIPGDPTSSRGCEPRPGADARQILGWQKVRAQHFGGLGCLGLAGS